MNLPTVMAVMKVTIEIPIEIQVRANSAKETFEQMYGAAKREAEGILRNKLPDGIRVIGPVEFSHAIVKERT